MLSPAHAPVVAAHSRFAQGRVVVVLVSTVLVVIAVVLGLVLLAVMLVVVVVGWVCDA